MSHDAKNRKDWYIDFLNRFSLSVINYCITNLGVVPKFVQSVILYDLHWKILQTKIPHGVLTLTEEKEYRSLLFSIFKYIDDETREIVFNPVGDKYKELC